MQKENRNLQEVNKLEHDNNNNNNTLRSDQCISRSHIKHTNDDDEHDANLRTCNDHPAAKMGSATWATALATRRHVETTPTMGANGRIFLTKFGKNLLVDIPMAMGAKTTCWYFQSDVNKQGEKINNSPTNNEYMVQHEINMLSSPEW